MTIWVRDVILTQTCPESCKALTDFHDKLGEGICDQVSGTWASSLEFRLLGSCGFGLEGTYFRYRLANLPTLASLVEAHSWSVDWTIVHLLSKNGNVAM